MQKENEMTLSEKWESLTLADNFLFNKIMSSDLDFCREILEMLLHIEIDHLKLAVAEASMQEGFDSHGVRLDVYTKNDGQIFDLEIQTTKKTNLEKRARYYQGVIDVDNLPAGVDYSKLKDSYVIFLCLEDVFKKGEPVYTFENICLENKELKLNDRSYKVFFNASAYDKIKNEREKDFFKLLLGKSVKTKSDFTERLREKVLRAKRNIDWRRQYMVWALAMEEEKRIAREEAREEGLAEGRAEGSRNTALQNARNLLAMNLGTIEQIARATGLSVEEVKSLSQK